MTSEQAQRRSFERWNDCLERMKLAYITLQYRRGTPYEALARMQFQHEARNLDRFQPDEWRLWQRYDRKIG
jgi:hypothetical protein